MRTPTVVPTRTPTATATPVRRLLIVQIIGRKENGNAQPLDILVRVRDDLGNPIDGATVMAVASNGNQSWSGTLPGTGSGYYMVCDVGAFNGRDGGGVQVTVTARKAGYQSGSGSATAGRGNLGSCN
jgi:hypothetical protein